MVQKYYQLRKFKGGAKDSRKLCCTVSPSFILLRGINFNEEISHKQGATIRRIG